MSLRGARMGAQGATTGRDPSRSTDMSVSGRAVCEARVPFQERGKRPPRVPDCTPRHPLAGQREADDRTRTLAGGPGKFVLVLGLQIPAWTVHCHWTGHLRTMPSGPWAPMGSATSEVQLEWGTPSWSGIYLPPSPASQMSDSSGGGAARRGPGACDGHLRWQRGTWWGIRSRTQMGVSWVGVALNPGWCPRGPREAAVGSWAETGATRP